MTLEGIAFGERFATTERELVGQQAFRQHGRRIYAVEIAMGPDGTLPETSGRRTDDKFHFSRASHRRSLLIQGVRVQRRVAVPEATVRRAPRTRWFGAALKNIDASVSDVPFHILQTICGRELEISLFFSFIFFFFRDLLVACISLRFNSSEAKVNTHKREKKKIPQ